jgi:hypothetical protein
VVVLDDPLMVVRDRRVELTATSLFKLRFNLIIRGKSINLNSNGFPQGGLTVHPYYRD